jgi:hypothetical protein
MSPERFIREQLFRYPTGIHVEKLLNRTRRECNLTYDEAVATLAKLRIEGKIKLISPPNHQPSVVWKWKR